MRRLSIGFSVLLLFSAQTFVGRPARAQNYISAVGNPSFGVNIPVPNGYINVANGNLHMEIPLATLKQRGSLQLNERMVYDSRIWEIVQYNNYYWWPLNVPNSQAGWRFVKGNETGTIGTVATQTQNTSCWTGIYNQPYQIVTTYYSWTDPNGTVHPFTASSTAENVPTNCPGTQGGDFTTTTNGYATDASGYFATLSSNANGAVSITVKDGSGNQVYPQVIDRYGNFWTSDASNNLIDDLGRTPVITTVNGNVTTYDVLSPNGPISNNGKRVRYTVTSEQITITTSFGQSGVNEYQQNSGEPATIPSIQSIELPDGSSYQFSYDNYGEMTSVTLPTGGVVSYGWTNYTDSYQNVNRWLSSSTVNDYETLYTPSVITKCSSNGTGCQEQVNVHRPSGDETVYTMTLDNGAWDTNTIVYSGAASANQAKLSTVNTYNFAIPCSSVVCIGAEDVTKATEVDSLPDAGLSAQTQTSYSNPQTGQLTSMSQWDFYTTGSTPSALPTRQVNYGYTNFDLTSETHLDGSGSTAASTTYTYTGTATATSGVVGHGTANAGGPYLTSVTATNNAPVGSSTTQNTYEDTGDLLSTQDANANPVTTYRYDPTHTFVTEVDRPNTATSGTTFSHVSRQSFDPNSGAILTSDDENSVANGQAYEVMYSYEPVAGRLQKVQYPKAVPTDTVGGSQTYAYPSPTEVDVTVAQTAAVNVTTAQIVDAYGRPSVTSSGSISTQQSYDANGRPSSLTNPTNGTGTTSGTTYTFYDALNRVSSVQNPDGTTRTLQVTGNVALATDEIGNQSKQVYDAFGELTSIVEADPVSGALDLQTLYTHDALGNVICVEQHGNVTGTGCSSPSSSDATSSWRVRRFFYNSLSQLRAASIPEHTTSGGGGKQTCGNGASGSWTDCYNYDPNGNLTSSVDNRGVTRTYTYDVLNRPLLKTSPNGTIHDLLYDGGPLTANAVGRLSHESNDVNAASSYFYDALGRLITEQSCRPSNCGQPYIPITATYDLAGNRTSLTYPDQRVVGESYDGLNRLSTVTYKQWGSTTVGTSYWAAQSYAAPGLLQIANYGNGVQMQAGFNNRLSLTSLSYQTTSPAAAQTFFNKTYLWDKNAANLLNETNQMNSQVRQFGYDKLNRLVSAVDTSGTGTHSTGTASVSGAEGSHEVCSSGATATSSVASPNMAAPPPPTCHVVYDTGSVTITVGSFKASATYASGSTSTSITSALATSLSASGSPVTVSNSGTTLILTSIATGTAADYTLSETGGDFTVALSGSTMTGGGGGAISGGLNQQYTLDAWGNLSSMGSSGFNEGPNLQNQVGIYGYDAAGRLQSDSTLNYTYDDDGMLLTSSDGTSYVYDAVGQRAQIAQAGVSKEYYYFGGQLIATLNPSAGTATGYTDFIYAGGQKIAEVAGAQAATPTYTLLDQVGSEVAVVNSAGSVVSSLDYTPFGQLLSGSSSDGFIYTGLERDNSGLDHAMYRQFSSTTGRWITPDPDDASFDYTNPQSANRYAYVGNKPLGFTDANGTNPLGILANIGLCFGGTDPAGCIAEVSSGPVGWATLGVSALLEVLDLSGVFGQPAFHGNVQAQHQGKSMRSASNSGNVKATMTMGPILESENGTYTMAVGYSIPVYAPSAIEVPSITWAQIGEGVASFASAIPAVAASALLLNMRGDNTSKPSAETCRVIVQNAKNTCTAQFPFPGAGDQNSKWRMCVRQIVKPTGCDF